MGWVTRQYFTPYKTMKKAMVSIETISTIETISFSTYEHAYVEKEMVPSMKDVSMRFVPVLFDLTVWR